MNEWLSLLTNTADANPSHSTNVQRTRSLARQCASLWVIVGGCAVPPATFRLSLA
jgi:hypothetical protein